MRRDKDGRKLEFQISADGEGALLVQEDDPAAQSVWLTTRELRWLATATPRVLFRSWWLRDGGWRDRLHSGRWDQ